MRKHKTGFKTIYYVDIKDNEGHSTSIKFPTETSALIYEKLLDIEEALKGEKKEEPLTEEEKALLEKLQKKAKK